MKIYVSPSTQENNVGVGDYGTEEKRMNQLVDILIPILEKSGHTCWRNNPSWTLEHVVDESNFINPDLHLALHTNANDGKSRGCMIFCHKLGIGSVGEKIARTIYNYLEPLTPSSDYGIKEGFNFYGLGKHMYETMYTNAPAILIEIDFHDNKNSVGWINSNMIGIANAITNGINRYCGIETDLTGAGEYYKRKYEELLNNMEELLKRYKG